MTPSKAIRSGDKPLFRQSRREIKSPCVIWEADVCKNKSKMSMPLKVPLVFVSPGWWQFIARKALPHFFLKWTWLYKVYWSVILLLYYSLHLKRFTVLYFSLSYSQPIDHKPTHTKPSYILLSVAANDMKMRGCQLLWSSLVGCPNHLIDWYLSIIMFWLVCL